MPFLKSTYLGPNHALRQYAAHSVLIGERVWEFLPNGPDYWSYGCSTFYGDPSEGEKKALDYVMATLSRYLDEKAKRSVVVSPETMMPIGDDLKDGSAVLMALQDGEYCNVRCDYFSDGWVFIGRLGKVQVDLSEYDVEGWWPLPDLSPMPADSPVRGTRRPISMYDYRTSSSDRRFHSPSCQ